MSNRHLLDLLPHTPIGWAAVGVAWCLIAVALGPWFGKRMADAPPPEPPPNPATLQPSDDWMNLVPSDSLKDDSPLLRERFDALVGSESWFVQ